MDAADRNRLRLVLPPLLGLGLAAALIHPLVGGLSAGPQPAGTVVPIRAATPQHTDGNTP